MLSIASKRSNKTKEPTHKRRLKLTFYINKLTKIFYHSPLP